MQNIIQSLKDERTSLLSQLAKVDKALAALDPLEIVAKPKLVASRYSSRTASPQALAARAAELVMSVGGGASIKEIRKTLKGAGMWRGNASPAPYLYSRLRYDSKARLWKLKEAA